MASFKEVEVSAARNGSEYLRNEFVLNNYENFSTSKTNKHRQKRFIGMIFNLIGLGFDIYSAVKGVQDDQELEKNFNEVFQSLDKNCNAIRENLQTIQNVEKKVDLVTETIWKYNQETQLLLQDIRLEMKSNFQEVLHGIKELQVGDKISSITTFVEYFWKTVDSRNDFSPNTRVTELERTDGILDRIRKTTNPDGSLSVNLYHIVNQRLAYPKDLNDNLGRRTLDVLYHGVQTYISSFFFVLQEYTFLANFYYERSNIDKYNEYLDTLMLTVADMKRSLLGNDGQNGLVEKVINIFGEVSELPFVRSERTMFDLLQQKRESLKQIQKTILETTPSIISDQPQKIMRKPNFDESCIQTPIGDWKDGEMVSYAMQFEKDNTFTKIGEWSQSTLIDGKASPQLKVPIDIKRRRRILYRKFNNGKPEFIGAIDDAYQTIFRDINRDLYNAASNFNENKAMEEMEIFIKNGADVNAVFEAGRQPIHAAAQAGNVNLAHRFLLANNVTDINAKDTNGFTAMHLAAAIGYEDFVELLLKHNANITKTDSEELTPLHIAAFNGHDLVLKALMTTDTQYHNSPDKHGYAPIHSAVFGGRLVVQALVSSDSINLNAKSNTELTPLHLAVLNNYRDVVEILLENKNLNANATAVGGFTALHFAAIMGNRDIIRLLCSKKEININAATIYGWTPLHYAVILKKAETVVELLGCRGVNVDAKADAGETPLHLAAYNGEKNIVLPLLENRAELEAETKATYTALHLAAIRGHLDVVTTLTERGANMEATTLDGSTPLLSAASSKSGNINVIKYLIGKGADREAFNDSHDTFIILMARFGSVQMLEEILEWFDTALQQIFLNGDTLLHSAVRGSNMPIVKYLVEKKNFQINIENQFEETPLCIAKIINDSMLINYLKNKKGVYNFDRCDSTVEQQAVRNGDLDLFKYFIEKKGSSSIDAALYGAYFRLAFEHEQWKIINYFIQRRVKIDLEWGTLLHIAAGIGFMVMEDYEEKNDPDLDSTTTTTTTNNNNESIKSHYLDVVKYLVEQGASVNAKDDSEMTPLHYAMGRVFELDFFKLYGRMSLFHYAENTILEIVKFLIDNGADVNATDKSNDTPLHIAAKGPSGLNLVKYLVEKGASVNAKNKFEETPLHFAAAVDFADRLPNIEMVKFLINNGANINEKDNHGNTPLALARNEDIKQYLRSKEGIRSRRSIKNDRYLVGTYYTHQTLTKNRRNLNIMKTFGLESKSLSSESSYTTQSLLTDNFSGFLTVENLAFIGCIVDTLDQSASKRYQHLRNHGVNVIHSAEFAVYDARKRFYEFVERKICTLKQEVQKAIREELKEVDLDIIGSLMRGVEFSGLVGLDDVLKMCKRCFKDYLLKNVPHSDEA